MYKKILEEISRYESIVIFGHIHPDGDCYGCQVALKEMIKTLYPNKEVYISGSGLPNFFDILPSMDVVSEDIIKSSLAIIIDANDLTRIEDTRVSLAKAFLKLDHHVDDGGFTEGIQLVNEKACSASEILYDFAIINNIPMNEIVAKALFLGILTDTARFQIEEDYLKVFSMSKHLIELGAKPYEIYQILNLRDENFLKLTGYIYSNYKTTPGGTLYVVFDDQTIKSFNMDALEVANKVGFLSNVKGFDIWIIFVERSDHRLTAEFRSSNINVNAIASKYGGGGHLHASGMTVKEFNMEFINQVLIDCDNAIKEGK